MGSLVSVAGKGKATFNVENCIISSSNLQRQKMFTSVRFGYHDIENFVIIILGILSPNLIKFFSRCFVNN